MADAVAEQRIAALLARFDDVRKAAPARQAAEVVRDQLAGMLAEARDLQPRVTDETRRLELAGAIARRAADLDRDALEPLLGPSEGVRPAPTAVDDPARVPPGQHLTAGWPVLHAGRVPREDPDAWRVTVTGLVRDRLVLDPAGLRALPEVTVTSDLHCVTGWSRLDNAWTGVRVRDVLTRAGVREGATHVLVAGHEAYTANLDLEAVLGDDVLLAWRHDGAPLTPEHGGPLRLVVPHRYGWKSVKWVTELRLLPRDVRGYWEERGYHDVGDPWREQRFR